MANNIYIGNDPLLGNREYSVQLQELDKLADTIAQRKQALMQMRGQMEQSQQPPQTQTPVWDEIETIVKSMSDKEFEIISNNEEYLESQSLIMAILQDKYMKMMRPVVEQSPEGKDALERHLTLVKRLKKTATKEVDDEINAFKDYKENYSDIPYAEYMKMKKKSKK